MHDHQNIESRANTIALMVLTGVISFSAAIAVKNPLASWLISSATSATYASVYKRFVAPSLANLNAQHYQLPFIVPWHEGFVVARSHHTKELNPYHPWRLLLRDHVAADKPPHLLGYVATEQMAQDLCMATAGVRGQRASVTSDNPDAQAFLRGVDEQARRRYAMDSPTALLPIDIWRIARSPDNPDAYVAYRTVSTPLDHPYAFYPDPPQTISDTQVLKKSLRPMLSNQDRAVIDPPMDLSFTDIWDAWTAQSQSVLTPWRMVNLTPEQSTSRWVGVRQCATEDGSRWMFWPPVPETEDTPKQLVLRLAAIDPPNPAYTEYPCEDLTDDIRRAWRMDAIMARQPVLSQEIILEGNSQLNAMPPGWYTVRARHKDEWTLVWKPATSSRPGVARILMQPEDPSREWIMTARDLSAFPQQIMNPNPTATIAPRPRIPSESSIGTPKSSHPRLF